MAKSWDLFDGDRMEVRRGLDTSAVRTAWARGELDANVLIRPEGSNEPWKRLAELPEFTSVPAPNPPPRAVTERTKEPATRERLRRAQDEPAIARVDDGLSLRDLTDEPAKTSERVPPDRRSSQGSTRSEPPAAFAASAPPPPPILPDEPPTVDVAELELDEEDDANDPQAEDEAATEFTLASRGGLKKEEDLDLAAMVDVAFQLILFFIVTATSMFYKTLEVPKPDQEKKDQNVQQQAARSLEELENDHILVEIDPEGGILVDHEPVPPEALVRTLMTAKKETSRPGILLVADFVTPHRNTVRALDAANEAGLRIALAKPGNAPPAATPAKSP